MTATGATVRKLDTDDLLSDEGCDIQSAQLRGEIINAFLDQQWCRKNYCATAG